MGKNILDLFDIKKGDIISITGCGGKTTLMYELAKCLKEYGRVLITTSTKIRKPTTAEANIIYNYFKEYKKSDKSICAIGELILEKNKFKSIGEENLIKIKDDFDYILIEADGSRNLPLKFWKKSEPVIYDMTTKTIAVFCAKVIDKNIEEDYIYNFNEFKNNIDREKVDKITFDKLINSNPGPFDGFNGDKFIFFNQTDSEYEKEKVDKVINYLRKNNKEIKFLSGSLLRGKYYED